MIVRSGNFMEFNKLLRRMAMITNKQRNFQLIFCNQNNKDLLKFVVSFSRFFFQNCIKPSRPIFLFLFMSLLTNNSSAKRIIRSRDDCYDNERNAQYCQPSFENIALMKRVQVSETCGIPATETFWRLNEENGRIIREYVKCHRRGSQSHPARFLNDIHDDSNATYWQSKLIENRRNVTLKISFGKEFELSYISLQFRSPRPESMAIYKSVDHGKTWIPFQYYARDCRAAFNLPNSALLNQSSIFRAFCREDSSDPLPMSGGRIHFKPIQDRPSENNFEKSQDLHDWITATDVKFVLTSINDVSGVLPSFSGGLSKRGAGKRALKFFIKNGLSREFQSSSEPHGLNRGSNSLFLHRKGTRRSAPSKAGGIPPATVLQYGYGLSSFYAINDIAIGGRCKCNGHASQCITKNGRLVCDCRHNTDGPNCEKCKAFHLDRPWQRATASSANECIRELF